MKKRSGYNVIELLIVITAISLIMAIGYKGVDVLYTNIKVEGVKSEISKLKTALARAQAVGSIYWGGQFVGSDRESMKLLTPFKNPTVSEGETCHYYDPAVSDQGPTCTYDNIISAEKELFKQMKEMEFEYRGSATDGDGTFRSSTFPTTSIGFTYNINGYSGIVFSDIPGNIAAKVYQDLNSPTWKPTEDGLSNGRPVLIFRANSAVNNPEALPGEETGFSELMEPVPGITEGMQDSEIFDIISSLPKVTMIYMYTYRKTEW